MNFFKDDKSQINESYMFKNNMDALFYWRVALTMLSALPWWCQIYEYSKLEFWRILTNWEFLTYWGVWSIHLYFLTSVIDMIYWKKNMSQNNKSYVSKFWKLQHFLFHFGFSTSLGISIMFWVAYYPDLPDSQKYNSWFMFNQIIQHVLLFFCIGIEFIYNNIRIAWKHLGLVLIATVVYMLVNLIVSLAYAPVYDSIDWVSVMCYIYIACVFIIVIIYFAFGKYIYEKYKLPRIQKEHQSPESMTIVPFDHQILTKV